MKKFILAFFAIVLFIAGAIVLLMPIPFGLIMMIVAILLLVSVSKRVAKFFKNYRKTNKWLNRKIIVNEKNIPQFLRGPLEKTNPDQP